jgi:predicted transcriptional regulator
MADKKNSPAQVYPELVSHLVEVSKTSYKLYKLTQPEAIAKQLGLTRQAIQSHIQKSKEEKV